MVIEFNVTQAHFRRQEEYEETQMEEEEENQYDMEEIFNTHFSKKPRRKEQVESGKCGKKSHKEKGNMEEYKILQQEFDDFPQREHSPMMDHYRSFMLFFVYAMN